MRRRPQFPCHLQGRDRCHGYCRNTMRASAKATSCGAISRHRVTQMVRWAAGGIQPTSLAKRFPWCSVGMAKHSGEGWQSLKRIEAARNRKIVPQSNNQWVSISRLEMPSRTERWRAWRQRWTGLPPASGAVSWAALETTFGFAVLARPSLNTSSLQGWICLVKGRGYMTLALATAMSRAIARVRDDARAAKPGFMCRMSWRTALACQPAPQPRRMSVFSAAQSLPGTSR
jgi:hypothetical protein